MSAIEMSTKSKFSYQRLRNEGGFEEGEEEQQEIKLVIKRSKSWSKHIRRVNLKRRLKIRIPGLRRFLRKKDRLFSAVRFSCNKVIKRLVEGRSHMGDIFAGNYLFMQVSPSSFKRPVNYSIGHDNIHGLASRYSLGKVV